MRFDGKKPIEFTDETVELEQANLDETKFVLKGSAPSTDSSLGEPTEEPDLDFGSEGGDDFGGEEGGSEKPFDKEPFDAGVEADEDTDPEKFIQQLSGKLGQSLRQHSEDIGQPDFDLEKFAVNSVLSATHTGEMDSQDQKDIINKVKGSGTDDGDDVDVDKDIDVDGGEEGDIDFGEEGVDEIVEELPMNDALPTATNYSMGMNPIDDDTLNALKDVAEVKEGDDAMWNNDRSQSADSKFGKDDQWESYLQESEKNGIFVNRTKVIKELRLMENAEPTIQPKPVTKPSIKPAKPLRETDRPFSPKRRTQIQPDPKAAVETDDGMINDEEK